MATIKILLVEDDKSLREIYAVRLQAEGYVIITASDGEQALAVAIKERPSLIISDVMMPKISGFDMLDILRSTTETKDIKVIMMTALSSDDQRARGEQIGADRYLVKSQVGIEDVVRTVHEVLGDKPTAPPAAPSAPTPPPSLPPVPPAAPSTPPAPSAPAAPAAPTPVTPSQTPSANLTIPVAGPPQTATPTTPPPTSPAVSPDPQSTQASAPLQPAASTAPETPSNRQRIIQPLNDPHAKVDINELLDRELAKEAGLDVNNPPQIATTAQEQAIVNSQLQEAAAPAPQPQPAMAAVQPAPTPPAQPSVAPERTQAPTPPPRAFDIIPPR